MSFSSRILRSPTWILGWRSGSSLMAKIPRLVRGLDGIDVADQVGDRDVGRGELLAIALVAVNPPDGNPVPLRRDAPLARGADRIQGIVVQLASLDRGGPLVQEANQLAQDPGLGLTPQPEEDEVVPAHQGV